MDRNQLRIIIEHSETAESLGRLLAKALNTMPTVTVKVIDVGPEDGTPEEFGRIYP